MNIETKWLDNLEISIRRNIVRIAFVAPECYDNIGEPLHLISVIRKHKIRSDILVFGQRLPEIKPKFNFTYELQEIAAMSITNYEDWWENQILKETRKNVLKAAKKGVCLREASLNDEFVNGVLSIYNESPIRQGKPFWHFNKDRDTVKKELNTYLDKSLFIGAYINEQMIGFIKLFFSDRCASTMQVISKIEHRDKKPNNALIAKCVEICSHKRVSYLQYGTWDKGTLGDFKRSNGFDKILIPVYYIPLTQLGNILLKIRLHKGLKKIMPEKLLLLLNKIRSKWYSR